MALRSGRDSARFGQSDAELALPGEAVEEVEKEFAMSRNLIFRAFKIADESMFEMLRAHCVGGGDEANLGLVNDAQDEVRTLGEASDAIQEAVDWLQPRGFVKVEKDDGGEFIAILKRPGCELCEGEGQYFAHADDCSDNLCALNGDQHSCLGKVVFCECAAVPGEGAEDATAEDLGREALRLNDLYGENLLRGANAQACVARDDLRGVLEQLANRCRTTRQLESVLCDRVGEEAAADIKALLEGLAKGPTAGPHHIYTHARDDNNSRANEAWHEACEPQRVERLIRLAAGPVDGR